MQMLKEFFLLGRGEVFSAFIEYAMSLLKVPPMGNTSHGKICGKTFNVLVKRLSM